MSFRVTRNSDGSITSESDCPGKDVDHVFAQHHHRQLSEYMRETGQSSIEGRDYNDIVNDIVDEQHKRYGGDKGALRAEVGTKLVW